MIYILSSGDYQYEKTLLATTDVKKVAKAYVDIIKDGGYGCLFKNPYIEIRRDGEVTQFPDVFHENTSQEKRLVKHLSKLAWMMEKEADGQKET